MVTQRKRIWYHILIPMNFPSIHEPDTRAPWLRKKRKHPYHVKSLEQGEQFRSSKQFFHEDKPITGMMESKSMQDWHDMSVARCSLFFEMKY